MPTLYEGYRGVTQGYLLLPTIFNVVVESVTRNWVMVLDMMELGAEELDALVQDLAEYFYVDN